MTTTTTLPLLRRLTAFTMDPAGGNPAGVWLGERLPEPGEMQRIAAEIGYSETAFAAKTGDGRYDVRYYSPEAEVSFCGHATIATGVLLGELEGVGMYHLATAVGDVPVAVERVDGHLVASLTSVDTQQAPASNDLLDQVMGALGWPMDVLDPAIPPVRAYAGAWHLVLALRDRATLDGMAYDFGRMKQTMRAADLTTIQVIWRESADLIHARNPFAVGGVVEDPATGASAAALGGYLRDARLIPVPASFRIRQGEVMGRPSTIDVRVPERGGVTVAGAAVALDEA